MQRFAFTRSGELISAAMAERHRDYYCLECSQPLRKREGAERQAHFYHRILSPLCRQHRKGEAHVRIQQRLFEMLPVGDAQLERHFPQVGRIADVAWLSQKIVFEIQCSPISAEELLARTEDYTKSGWQAVWILHDATFNQTRTSRAEQVLFPIPHYFCNINRHGEGMVYDQYRLIRSGRVERKLPPLPVDLAQPRASQPCTPPFLALREQRWGISFEGDLLDLYHKSPSHAYVQQVLELERTSRITLLHQLKAAWTNSAAPFFKNLLLFFLDAHLS